MKHRYYMASFLMVVLLALPGCYIPSGMYRVKATKVESAYTADGRCHMEERDDGWTIITCPEDRSKQSRPEETE
jgi:hypothetical protein